MPSSALAWKRAVEAVVSDLVEEPAVVLDSIAFVRSLDPLAEVGADDPRLAEGVTEAVLRWLEAAKEPYGDVEYADPGYQKDKQKRYPLDTDDHIRAAWSYINQADNADQYSAQHLALVKSRIRAAMKRIGAQVSEAVIDGARTFDEIEDLVKDALTARLAADTGSPYPYCRVVDLTESQVVYTTADEDDLWMCSYEIGDDQSVTLGQPQQVVRTYAPQSTPRNPPPEDDDHGVEGEADDDDMGDGAMEAITRVPGRVIEAKGTDANGGKVFRVRILRYGESRNRRDYPASVMREAVSLYEGAKAYDHHRTAQELETSTLDGLIGYYRGVEAETDGVYGNLHLLPSATRAAEALEASIDAQEQGLPPVVGISHDVQAHFRQVVRGGRRVQEATQIVGVQSADVVANPSAGGQAVRAVAGGEDLPGGEEPAGDESEETDVPVTTESVLEALKTATPEQLGAVGLQRVAAPATESTTSPPVRAVESDAQRVTEADTPKASFMGKLLIRSKVEDAGLPASVVEAVSDALPERITEASVDAQIAAIKAGLGIVERAGLRPTVTAEVATEAIDKKRAALDAFFAGDFSKGYRSFREAVLDFTGHRPRVLGEDVTRYIMRECVGQQHYDSADRATESLSAASWNLVLGDSITRRLVAEYNQPNLQTWRQIVSSTIPVNDFRTQRIDRIGGYGTLPAVNQGAPYQPLTSPSNEEVTYAITKRGGTEDVTLEMIANDDVRAISKIPTKLGLAAANTLYQFVWNFITTAAGTATNSGATIYDSASLFTNAHANFVNSNNGSALSQSALSAARLLMRSQTAYGDSQQFIAPIPKTLIVVNDIEELAWQLVNSAVALPTPANTPPDSTGAANTPNLHQGLNLVVLDYIANATSTTAWWLAADPNMIPTIEIGFYQGQDTPSLFTQSDPTVGSMFNADKVTYKIRHIYSGAVLDYRGFVKGNV